MFNCTIGGCINVNLVCDGEVDCVGDKSDEEDCRKLNTWYIYVAGRLRPNYQVYWHVVAPIRLFESKLQYHRLPAWGFLSITVYVISNQYCAISTYNYWSTCQLATVKAPSPNFLVHVTFCLETRLGPRRPCFTVSISGGIKLVEGGEGRREGGRYF